MLLKKASLRTLVRLSTSKIIVLSRKLIFCPQDLAYPEATGKLLTLGRLVTGEAPQDSPGSLEWIGLSDRHAQPLPSQGWELGKLEPQARDQMTCLAS